MLQGHKQQWSKQQQLFSVRLQWLPIFLPTAVKWKSLVCRRPSHVPELLLQFGHSGCIQTHRHNGGSGCITHLSNHASPLFLVLFIPSKIVKTSYDHTVSYHCKGKWTRRHIVCYLRTAKCRWFRLVHTLCSRSPPWRSLLQCTTSLHSWPGSLSSSPGETLGRVTTCNKVHSVVLMEHLYAVMF